MVHIHSLIRRIAPHLVPTALALIFAACAWEVSEGHPLAIDRLAASLASAIPAALAVPLGQALSNLPFVAAPIILLVLLLQRRRREAALVTGATVSALASAEILKLVFLRPRPEMMLVAATDASFPSGHTTTAFALATICALIWMQQHAGRRRLVPALLVASAVLVGMGRIILGVHFASDVIAGAALGTLVSWICWQLFAGVGAQAAAPIRTRQKGHAWSA